MSATDRQWAFLKALAKLIQWVYAQPGMMTVTGWELYRTPEQAALYAKEGKGIADSKHCRRLACDLNLFISGEYQADSMAYLPLGEYWETLGGVWGGRWTRRPDGNHFEWPE